MTTQTERTVAALLLYAVRNDCDSSMRLLRITDHNELRLITHMMSHILGDLMTEEYKHATGAEAAVERFITELAGAS